mgnify:CR=1 FL=1
MSTMTNRIRTQARRLSLLLIALLTMVSHLSAAAITRGPYLQIATPTSIVIRWRTDVATNSRIQYGTAAGSLTSTFDVAASVTEHEITLNGLAPNTTYWYSVGSTTQTLAIGADHFFLTSPSSGKPTRIWVLGDSGTANANVAAVRDAYKRFTGSRHTDFWLMLGDNAYNNGTDAEYQAAVFKMFPEMLRKSALFSTRGNHENTDANGSVYYNIFSMPTAAQAGGLA